MSTLENENEAFRNQLKLLSIKVKVQGIIVEKQSPLKSMNRVVKKAVYDLNSSAYSQAKTIYHANTKTRSTITKIQDITLDIDNADQRDIAPPMFNVSAQCEMRGYKNASNQNVQTIVEYAKVEDLMSLIRDEKEEKVALEMSKNEMQSQLERVEDELEKGRKVLDKIGSPDQIEKILANAELKSQVLKKIGVYGNEESERDKQYESGSESSHYESGLLSRGKWGKEIAIQPEVQDENHDLGTSP